MQVFETISGLRAFLAAHRTAGQAIGFVPTMGYLHAGHMSLVQAARRECTVVVLSIFVNPTQFGPQEDFATYPRDMAGDLRQAQAAGVDAVFAPTVEEMYPAGFLTSVTVRDLTTPLCGASRPGHFDGVTTVVAKLLNIVGADRAYFGQKDYQQVTVLRKMATDLCMPVAVVTCPTIREPDGLAMSSRNAYLNPAERQAALVLTHTLQLAEARLRHGERQGQRLAATLRDAIAQEPLACLAYVAVCDPETLREMLDLRGQVLVALAVSIGKTRLIDNALFQI
ncbi:MAG: pantoate--beta-alanine ligase [Candidatus Tectomicrobia bacterium]|uniref:Pantothenate synthetase n=1 Tax=Tectimicrobiota bacterium TaxID=2528274 RepID=A0A937W028_UNCTE|nr:pantoate--beta-alanine ligase [Candidatus Tectomicrobia bacterium]